MKQLILGAVILLAALSIKAQTFVIHTDSSFQQEGNVKSSIVYYPTRWEIDSHRGTIHLKTKDLDKTYPIREAKKINDVTILFSVDMGNRQSLVLVSGNPRMVIMGDSNIQFHFKIISIEQFETINF